MAAISISTLTPLRRPRAPAPTLAFAQQALSALLQMVLLLTVLVAFAVVQRAHQRQVSFATTHTASARPLPFQPAPRPMESPPTRIRAFVVRRRAIRTLVSSVVAQSMIAQHLRYFT